MATQSSKLGLVRLLLRASKLSQRGFTLIELLVVVIIGSLIMGSLLYLVTELMQVNRREEVLTQTQQDMQRAMDYMTRDVREAVFVYSTPSAIVEPDGGTETLLDQLDGIPAGSVPILAFWRLDPVDPTDAFWGKNCSTAFSGAKTNECNTLRLRQSFYTLVIYLQQPNDPGDLWGGPARIVRYELPKYSASDVATLTQRKGYSDPTGCATFANWSRPPGWDSSNPCDSTNTGTTAPTIAVLTDYVNLADLTETCPAGAIQTPATDPQGILACVSTGTGATGDVGANQTLRLFLQGNATEGRPGIVNALSDSGGLPTLEAEILVRGVLNKQPPGVTP